MHLFAEHPILLVLLAMVTTAPVVVLVHELGHSRALRRVAGRRSIVLVGTGPVLLIRHLEHFDLRISLFAFNGGACIFDQRGLTVAQLRACASAGASATVVLGLVFALGAMLIADPQSALFWVLVAGFVDALIGSVVDLFPWRSSGTGTDGLTLWALRGLPGDFVPLPTDRRAGI